MPRKTDASNPADWLWLARSDLVTAFEPLCDALTDAYFTDRYPGFDLDDPDWPALTKHMESVSNLIETVAARLSGPAKNR